MDRSAVLVERTQIPLCSEGSMLQAIESSVRRTVYDIETHHEPSYLSIALDGLKLVDTVPTQLRSVVGSGYNTMQYNLEQRASDEGPEVKLAAFVLQKGFWTDKTFITTHEAPAASWAHEHDMTVFSTNEEEPPRTLSFSDTTFLLDQLCKPDVYLGALADPRDSTTFAEASYRVADVLRGSARQTAIRRSYTNNDLQIAIVGGELYTAEANARLEIASLNNRRPYYRLSLTAPYETQYGPVVQHYTYGLDSASHKWDSTLQFAGSAGVPKGELKKYATSAAGEFDAPRAIARAISLLTERDALVA